MPQVLDRIAKEKTLLEGAGYTQVENLGVNKNGKREWSFVHSACGTSSRMVFGNIQSGLKKDPTNPPCSFCGSKRRTANATKSNTKYGSAA
jgi:hypothetical protein